MKSIIRFAIGLGALVGANAASFAQSYPDRPVKIIVPFAPAGPTDVIARIVADKLSISLGKQFYVQNHPVPAATRPRRRSPHLLPMAIRCLPLAPAS